MVVSRIKRGLMLSFFMSFIGLVVFTTPVQAQIQDGRPNLSNEQTFDSTHFLIHYTQSGDNAVPNDDSNGNGVPDHVEETARLLDEVWDIEVNNFGWTAPPQDEGEGGDQRIDVYLHNIMPEGIAGYVQAGGFTGDNPNSPERERRASYGFMGLDNDYQEAIDFFGNPEAKTDLLTTTVAHEFNHLIQAGYDTHDQHTWLYESTASWMEDEVFDDVNDNIYYLYDLFEQPDKCFVSEDRWYANWLFLRLISERYGAETIRAIWEHNRTMDGFDAIDAALEPFGSSMAEEMADFAVANLLRDYDEGALYPTVVYAAQLDTGRYDSSSGVQSFGSNYIELIGSGVVSVRVETDFDLITRVVGVRGNEADMFETLDEVVIDLNAYEAAYVVVQNPDRILPDENCRARRYSVIVDNTTASLTIGARVWLADNFSPLSDEAVAPDGEVPIETPIEDSPFREDEELPEPDSLEVSFTYIVPDTLPPGYEFDFAYILTTEDFADVEEFYIPGGGLSANLDYINRFGDWIGVTQSLSPYASLDEWMDAVGYDDSFGEWQNYGGTDVFVEDLSEEDDPWFSATFIVKGLFVVIDTDGSTDDLGIMADLMIQSAQNIDEQFFEGDLSGDESLDENNGEEVAGDNIPDNELNDSPAEEPDQSNDTPRESDTREPDTSDEDTMRSLLASAGLLVICGGLCMLGAGGLLSIILFIRRRRN